METLLGAPLVWLGIFVVSFGIGFAWRTIGDRRKPTHEPTRTTAGRQWQDNADAAAVMLQQEAAQNREQAALIISLADAQRAKRGLR
jgi:hypothetical protein